MKFSSFFLLACGAVVREGEALAGFKEVAERYFHKSLNLLVTDFF